MNRDSETVQPVDGERAAAVGMRFRSAQARAGNVLALLLICSLGLGSLAWYYTNAMARQGRVKHDAQVAAARRVQGDAVLPSLGRIAAPAPAPFEPVPPSETPLDRATPSPRMLEEIPLAPIAAAVPTAKTPGQLALDREMSGTVFATRGGTSAAALEPTGLPVSSIEGGAAAPAAGAGDLAAWLRPAVAPAVHARVLPGQRLLLPRGAFIDCTLETAIDSTLPGLTTCVMATDAFGADGKVVLLERGTKLIGETRGQVQQGGARVFVIWTEARTPAGVVIPLDSPGADELGRSGIEGEVNRHFWQRFGAALLVSVVDGAVQAAAQPHGGAGEILVNPSGSQEVITEVLKNTIGIPPTVTKRNGERIQVLVARDVDFRSVYELRSVNAGR